MFIRLCWLATCAFRQTRIDRAQTCDALLAAGIDARHLFEDHASGAKDDRPGLAEALEFACSGDVLVVWKLDRLGRYLATGNEKALGLLRRISPAAWQHLHFLGHYGVPSEFGI